MRKEEFAKLLHQALEAAAENAEERLARSVPRHFEIVLHGAGHSGTIIPLQQAIDTLYLGPERFYRIIDVAIIAISEKASRVFIRPSGHTPSPFEETWNDPPGSGPFKQILAQEITVE